MTRIADRIEAALGVRPADVGPLSGGCVGDVRRATLPDGKVVVVKLDDGPEPRLDVEGAMLRYLRERSDLPVPGFLHDEPRMLVIEFIDPSGADADASSGDDPQTHGADLLAALHDVTSDSGDFGFGADTLIGGLRQPNPWTTSWLEFFRDQRLRYMAHAALDAGRLPKRVLDRVETLAGRLGRWLPTTDRQPAPSLIHGDVWGGNVLAGRRRIAGFIDPAIYYADAEIELAFTTLFGTFGERFFRRYAELRPIADGFFEERRDLYNLYPLLVHVRLFGGGYVGQVEATLGRFGV